MLRTHFKVGIIMLKNLKIFQDAPFQDNEADGTVAAEGEVAVDNVTWILGGSIYGTTNSISWPGKELRRETHPHLSDDISVEIRSSDGDEFDRMIDLLVDGGEKLKVNVIMSQRAFDDVVKRLEGARLDGSILQLIFDVLYFEFRGIQLMGRIAKVTVK